MRTEVSGAWLLGVTAAILALASPASAASFSAGRFVVRGKPLLTAGRLSAGHSVSVFAKPTAVTVDGCTSAASRVRVRRAAASLAARLVCRGIPGRFRLEATIRATTMRGRLIRGRRARAFDARLVAPPGVVLRGPANDKATGAVRNTNKVVRHSSAEVTRSGHEDVLRTELVLDLARGARIGEVNAALARAGGRIVTALAHFPILVVSIPDPGSIAVLDALRAALGRMAGVRLVRRSLMPEPNALPPQFASPPTETEADASAHLLAMRMPAAWNALAAIRDSQRPLVLVADVFGNGPLDRHVAVDPFSAALLTTTPSCRANVCFHGYHVTGIIAGDFPDDLSPAGLVTGVFPKSSRFLPLDVTGMSLPEVVDALQQTLDVEPGHVVVNTSLGQTGGGLPSDDARLLGSLVTGNVRAAGLEGRVFQATSAGNDGISARDNSPWTATRLRSDLIDLGTGHPIAPLRNTVVVENNDQTGAPDYRPTCRWDGIIEPSNFGGNVSADGVSVYSNKLGADAGPALGTSMSSPQVAGLAEYLWSIAPDLSSAQLADAIERTAEPATGCGVSGAPHVDAYAATLSLDQPGCFAAACAPVRFSILDQNGDGRFDQLDLQAFADHIFRDPAPTERDWSRYDLNGDGFTGGEDRVPFDLDTTGSVRAGAPTLNTVGETIHDTGGNPLTFQVNERSVTDADILCYYAYSGLYTPAATNDQRDDILGNRCAPVEILSCGTNTDLEADASVPSDPSGGDHKNGNVTANPPRCSPPLAESPPALTAQDSGTCNVPQSQPCSADSSARAAADGSGTADASGATISASFTAETVATISTGGSSHADSDGDASVSFQLNATCSYSVSGSVSTVHGAINSSAGASMSLSGSGLPAPFRLSDGSGGQSGTLSPGTYSLSTSGVADTSAFNDVASSDANLTASGSLTITC